METYYLGLLCVSIATGYLTGNDAWGLLMGGIGLIIAGLMEYFCPKPEVEEDEF